MSHASRPRPVLIAVGGRRGWPLWHPVRLPRPFVLSFSCTPGGNSSTRGNDDWYALYPPPIDSKRARERVANIHGAARQGGLTQEIVVPKVSGITRSLPRSPSPPAAGAPNLRNAIFDERWEDSR